MKALQFIALVLVSTLFLFSSCEKDPLTPEPVSQDTSNLDLEDYPILTIDIKEIPCSELSKSLQVYRKTSDGIAEAIDSNNYKVEWHGLDYELIEGTDIVYCLDPGKYIVTVWDRNTYEKAIKHHKVN